MDPGIIGGVGIQNNLRRAWMKQIWVGIDWIGTNNQDNCSNEKMCIAWENGIPSILVQILIYNTGKQ